MQRKIESEDAWNGIEQAISAIRAYCISLLCHYVDRPLALTGPYLQAILLYPMTVFTMHTYLQFTLSPLSLINCLFCMIQLYAIAVVKQVHENKLYVQVSAILHGSGEHVVIRLQHFRNNKIKFFWIVQNIICEEVLIFKNSLLPHPSEQYSQIHTPTTLPSNHTFLQASTLKMEAVVSSKTTAI